MKIIYTGVLILSKHRLSTALHLPAKVSKILVTCEARWEYENWFEWEVCMIQYKIKNKSTIIVLYSFLTSVTIVRGKLKKLEY